MARGPVRLRTRRRPSLRELLLTWAFVLERVKLSGAIGHRGHHPWLEAAARWWHSAPAALWRGVRLGVRRFEWGGPEHDETCLGGSGLVAGEIGFGGRRELAAFCRFAGLDEELFG